MTLKASQSSNLTEVSREFVSSEFLEILTSFRISQQQSPPYYHVALAEITIRTVKDNIRAFIEDSYTNLSRAASKGRTSNPYIFWSYAAKHACNVIRLLPHDKYRSYSASSPRISRYEAFFQIKPDYT